MLWLNNVFSIWLNPKDTNRKKAAKFKNNFVFQNEFSKLTQDALNRYHIEGLPSTVSERVVLQSLLWYGYVFFFKKQDNILALPGLPDGSGLNAYGDFNGAYVYGANGFNERISLIMPGADDSRFLKKTIDGTYSYGDGTGVMVWENPLLYPFINTVYYFAQCIADAYRTEDVCRMNIKRPFIVTAEESVVPTVKKYFEDAEDNLEYIISSGVFPADKITVQPFDANPEYVRVASALIDWYEQKFRERCGFKNQGGAIDKKGENLISDEITQNDEYTEQSVDQVVKYIQQGLDLVNEKFGTNMTAEVKEYEDVQRNDREQFGDVSDESGRGDKADDI